MPPPSDRFRRALPGRLALALTCLTLALLSGVVAARAREASVKAKHFPASFFYRYDKIPLQEKAKVLAKLEATLKKLRSEGYGLVAKGAVIEKPGPEVRTYQKLTVLDESGLIIIAHQVPNLYYRYRGPAGLNPNIYLVIRNARVNFPESYIRYGYVVEGDYVAYVHKFVSAILEGLERAAGPPPPPPARPPR